MRETQKIEGFRSAATLLGVGFGKPSEFDYPRLLRRQLQPELGQPGSYFPQDTLRVALVLRTDNEVVALRYQFRVTPQLLLRLPLEPEGQNLVQVNVRQNRAD